MRRYFLHLFLTLLSVPLLAQKHPFTFEEMMALKRVEEPEPSPDGKWVLFAAVDVDLKANTRTPHVWIVPLNQDTDAAHPSQQGGEREIIGDQDADRPRWAPDGKRFAFVSTKEGGSQIWVADFDGETGVVTATHKLTSIATEASGELWSTDGRYVLFASDVYPECRDEECNARKVDEAKNSKVKALIFTHLLYRHWNAYKEGKRSHLFVTEAPPVVPWTAGARLIATYYRVLTPGDYDAPQFNLGGQDNYASHAAVDYAARCEFFLVCAALRDAAERLALLRLFATFFLCFESAVAEAPARPSLFNAFEVARDLLREVSLVFATVLPLFLPEERPLGGGGNFIPALRAFDSPMAIACFALRTPCFPSRTWWISSRTNSPA